MTAMPRVSFLVPCFNQGRFLDEAIDSVLAQTCQDFEILVVDDGSTDAETHRLLADYQRPRTTVLRTPNLGLAGARNLALAQAGGEFVSALDADDKLAPRFLEAMLATFDADPGLTFCSAWQHIFGDEEWEWRQQRCDLPALLAENTVLPASLVRRGAVLEAGGWDAAMPASGYEDWDLWISLVERGHRGTILHEVLFYYRRHAAAMSAAIAADEATHLALVGYLFTKHEQSYRRHLWEVFDLMQQRGASALHRIYDQERWLATWVEPQAADLRAELVRLRARLAHAREEPGHGDPSSVMSTPATDRASELEAALAAARREIDELRTSLSWRLTAPLRALYGRLSSPPEEPRR